MISWITENVAIGEYTDAYNRENLIKEKIDCILSLRGEGVEENAFAEIHICNCLGIDFYRVPVTDVRGTKNIKIQLKTAVYMLDLLAEKYNRILVHCTEGIDRAPFVVALYLTRLNADLAKATKLNTSDLKFWMAKAYDFIQDKRPQIKRHMEWI